MKKYRLSILAAYIQWLVTLVLGVDRLFFDYTEENLTFIVVKGLMLVFLIGIWCLGTWVYYGIKAKDALITRAFLIFTVYALILSLILVIVWPGMWSWDDVGILIEDSGYRLFPWQHILTGIFHMVFLSIIPCPGGVILLQNLVCAICVAYVTVNLEIAFNLYIKNKYADIILKLLPFLLFPVIRYQFSGYRMGLYVYLELVILTMMFCHIKKTNWTMIELVLFGLLSGIVAVWRTEAIFYIPIVAVFVILVRSINIRRKLLVLISMVGVFLITNYVQNRLSGSNEYQMLATVGPCTAVVSEAIRNNSAEDLELISAVDRVLDVNVIASSPGLIGRELYWSGTLVREGYTNEDYEAYKEAFIKLCMQYPGEAIKERMNMFLDASGVHGANNNALIKASAGLFRDDEEWTTYWTYSAAESFNEASWSANKPVFNNIRRRFITYIIGLQNRNEDVYPLFYLMWTPFIPMLTLIIGWFYSLVKKKWMYLLPLTAIVVRIPVVILSETSGWLMYFLPMYLCGYVLLVYGCLGIKRKETNEA